jgi:hypothetical protein
MSSREPGALDRPADQAAPGVSAPAREKASARPARLGHTRARTDQRILLTLDQVLVELGGPGSPLGRSTWQDWQRRGVGPKVIKLPNGQIRVARDDLNAWLEGLTRDPDAS